ncbi:MAG: ammonium transporter [Planctomycetota bacterium]
MRRRILPLLLLLGFFCLIVSGPVNVVAQEPPQEAAAQESNAPPAEQLPVYDKGDVAWMLTSAALVLMMTGPGLLLFYGGLVRKKNVLSIMMQCVFLMGLNSILWVVIGYSLAFSSSGVKMWEKDGTEFHFVGGFDHVLLEGINPYLNAKNEVVFPPAGKIPAQLFMVYQMMFFIITPALIVGAFAERMKFSAMVVFSALWGLIVYCPLAHWVWGPNAIFGSSSPYHALDFAGGLVVHASSGISALVCALVLGKRIGYGTEPMPPHNLTYTVIGTCLLWVGWFGFNAGSALEASTSAVNAFVVTHLCAATGLLTWAGIEWVKNGKPSVLGACSGAVAGLVVITPASGFVTPGAAIILGLFAGSVCFLTSTKLKAALGYDDSLDVFGIHGVGGAMGAILTGFFVSKDIYPGFPKNVIVNQFMSVIAAYILSIACTYVILKVIDVTIGLRASHEDEIRGLDITQHHEEGYIYL